MGGGMDARKDRCVKCEAKMEENFANEEVKCGGVRNGCEKGQVCEV